MQNEVGLVDNPLKISWLEGQPQRTEDPSHPGLSQVRSQASLSCTCSGFEDLFILELFSGPLPRKSRSSGVGRGRQVCQAEQDCDSVLTAFPVGVPAGPTPHGIHRLYFSSTSCSPARNIHHPKGFSWPAGCLVVIGSIWHLIARCCEEGAGAMAAASFPSCFFLGVSLATLDRTYCQEAISLP